jgi:hypothetical protein
MHADNASLSTTLSPQLHPCLLPPDVVSCCCCLLQYAEMEMRHRFVNHARNVWDRAVSLLPRVDQLWYK